MMAQPVARLPLAGISVVITRPRQQAERVANAIAAAGGEPIVFPTIEIEPLPDSRAVQALVYRLDDYYMAIFVSANAVEQGMPYLLGRSEIPARLNFAAIGEATRKALLEHGIMAVLAPVDRHDSEALLDLPELREVAGRRMVIFRGEGGRQTLAETLANRGAIVDHAVCYRRTRPLQDVSGLQARWLSGRVHAVSAMSLESLKNLYDMIDVETRALLAKTPVLVPHPRIAEAAGRLGLQDVRVTGPGDDALMEGLQRCRKI